MKYWRGYIAAAIIAAITVAVTKFAEAHSVLVDMVYPYVSRLIQTTMADWSAGVDVCMWQIFAILLVCAFVASIVLMIIFRWNVAQWLGWVLTGVSLVWMLHTAVYGLNNYAGPLAEDIRLEVTKYNVTELTEATTYFRDQANALAQKVERTDDGTVKFPSFEELAEKAPEGFKTLTYDYSYSVFAGSDAPVKKLGWSGMYTSMGIAGVTMPLTGESAVNPNLPAIITPYIMCHELAHRTCIASERDANFAAFLACRVNEDPAFQYSGYFTAFRYCYNALASISTTTATSAAKEILAGLDASVKKDLEAYRDYLLENQDPTAVELANTVNDAYINASGDESGIQSYGQVCDLLVSWHIQEIYAPIHGEVEEGFDPTDRDQVDLG